MTRPSSERTREAAALANRLRLIQVDDADEQEDVRRRHLSEAIDRAMADVDADDRGAFLLDLQDRFPAWGAQEPAPIAPAPENADAKPRRSGLDEEKLKDPFFALSLLLKSVPEASEENRQSIIRKLGRAGLAPPQPAPANGGGGDWPHEASGTLCEVMQISAPADLDPARVVEMATALFGFATSLDALMKEAWKEIAGRNEMRRTSDLRTALGRYVGAGGNATEGHPSADLESLQRMIGACIAGIRTAGVQFAQRHLAKYSPGAVEQMVLMDGRGRRGRAAPADCWKQYEQLMDGTTRDTLAREINQAVADFAMELLKGTDADPQAIQGGT